MLTLQPLSLRARVSARRRFPFALLLILAAAALGAVMFASLRTAEAVGRDDEKAAGERPAPDASAAAEAYRKLPLQFEANPGPTDERGRLRGRGAARDAAKADDKGQGYSVLRIKLAGANASPKVEGLEELSGKVN